MSGLESMSKKNVSNSTVTFSLSQKGVILPKFLPKVLTKNFPEL